LAEGECALCKKYKGLRRSHIIPKFVSKWLKETSATGFLRGVKNPKKRMQDLPKLPLLCGDCEQLFSKLEFYFASKIFYPILNGQKEEIAYDETLRRFIISLSWRTLKTGYSDQVKHDPWIKEHLNKAEEIWREYLLHESSDSGSYDHHMFFIGYAKDEAEVPRKFQWYTLRGTDSTLVSSQNTVFAFTHFPHVFFISTIYPLTFSDWKSTKIENEGKFTTKSEINDYYFWDFLVSRCRIISSSIKGSTSEKIAKSLEKKPEKFLKSESLAVMIEESKRERLKRIKKLPKSIQALVDIIDRSVDNPELNPLQQSWANYTRHIVANALSYIPLDTATVIDALIQSTIMLADEKHRHTQCDFETRELIAKFMVTICDTKSKQLELLQKAIDALVKKKDPKDERIIVAFSFNPLDEEMPYETAYYTG
jgi:hypothetical protein